MITDEEFNKYKNEQAIRFKQIANIIELHNKTFDVLGSTVKIQQEHLKELDKKVESLRNR